MTDYNERVDEEFGDAVARYAADVQDLDMSVELVTKDIMFALMPLVAADVRARYEQIFASLRQAFLTEGIHGEV